MSGGALDRPLTRDRVRQGVVVASVVGGLTSGAIGEYRRLDASEATLTPAPWAFTIWGPIYAGSFAYAAAQALPAEAGDEELRRVGWPAAVAYLGAGLWIRVAGRPGWYVPVVLTTTAAANLAHHGLDRGPSSTPGRRRRLLVRIPVSAFAGWLTVAAAVSLPEAVGRLLGRDPATVDRLAAWPVLVATTALVSARALRVQVSTAYPVAAAWGLVGTSVRQWQANRPVAVGAGAGALALGVIALRQLAARR